MDIAYLLALNQQNIVPCLASSHVVCSATVVNISMSVVVLERNLYS